MILFDTRMDIACIFGEIMIYKSNSVKETHNIAKAFSKTLKGGEIILLNGDLGVGKTAFVQGLCNSLGVGDKVCSPTFTIVNTYEGEKFNINHFDVYRIDDSDEMFEIGFEEYIYSDDVSLIEWSEKIADILPDNCININISKDYSVHEDFRLIEIC